MGNNNLNEDILTATGGDAMTSADKRDASANEADGKTATDGKKLTEAKKTSDDKKQAEAKKKADDAKKKADAKHAADEKKQAEAKKKADAKRAADEKKRAEAKKKAEEAKKKSDTKKKDSTKKKGGGLKYLSGLLFAKMMKGGADELRAHAEKVNNLNVFPVPDGDTGDNMSMTIESGVAALETLESDDLAEVMKVASKGMLLGARGNSGVILSQFFAGMAKNLEKADTADPQAMGRALQAGVDQAYASVMTPTEGTILTVARESVEYAIGRLTPNSTIRSLFADLVKEMYVAVERTPETLAVLKDAGVVDSGGAGLFYIIDGLNKVLNGKEVSHVDSPSVEKGSHVELGGFGPDSEMTYGYCTEVLLQLQNSKCNIDTFDLEELKSFLSGLGDSVVAFKTDSVVKVHVHTLTPDRVLEYGRRFGEFLTVKIENMSLQHSEVIVKDSEKSIESTPGAVETTQPVSKIKKKYAIVTVATGEGIKAVFSELGADVIVEGGQTNNPSTSDFLNAFGMISAEHIFVLPNNSNIIMAATQAADIWTESAVHVLPAKTIGAGYAALSSYNPDAQNANDIIAELENAINSVTSAYVSPSVRDADMNGVHVTMGDTIGVIGKEIVVSSESRNVAVRELLTRLLSGGDRFMLTVFCGKDASAVECSETEAYVRDTFPDVECYFLDGHQEIYPYIFVAE